MAETERLRSRSAVAAPGWEIPTARRPSRRRRLDSRTSSRLRAAPRTSARTPGAAPPTPGISVSTPWARRTASRAATRTFLGWRSRVLATMPSRPPPGNQRASAPLAGNRTTRELPSSISVSGSSARKRSPARRVVRPAHLLSAGKPSSRTSTRARSPPLPGWGSGGGSAAGSPSPSGEGSRSLRWMQAARTWRQTPGAGQVQVAEAGPVGGRVTSTSSTRTRAPSASSRTSTSMPRSRSFRARRRSPLLARAAKASSSKVARTSRRLTASPSRASPRAGRGSWPPPPSPRRPGARPSGDRRRARRPRRGPRGRGG